MAANRRIAIKRCISRISIAVCVLLVAVAALLFTVEPRSFPFAALLGVDVPAFIAIIGFRVYLRGSRS